MRRAAKTDATQQAIVRMLRQCGMSVETRLSAAGKGIPDLLVGWRGVNVLLEAKTDNHRRHDGPDGDKRLTQDEADWHAAWGGQVAIVSTPDEAVAAVLRAAGEKR